MSKAKEVVVITGASAGVGRATARLFGEHGACVGLIARSRRRLEAAKKEIEAAGGHSLALVADVANAQEIETAAEQIENEFGPIDIWINNAMATVFAPFHEVTPEEFRRTTEVTYLGYVYGTMAALKRMKPRDRGVIVQVGSALQQSWRRPYRKSRPDWPTVISPNPATINSRHPSPWMPTGRITFWSRLKATMRPTAPSTPGPMATVSSFR